MKTFVFLTSTYRCYGRGRQIHVPESSRGATAEVNLGFGYAVTYNDLSLLPKCPPFWINFHWGEAQVIKPVMGAEDFSFFQQKIPGVFFALGVNREGVGMGEASVNHSPYFYVNDDALPVGVKALSTLAMEWLSKNAGTE